MGFKQGVVSGNITENIISEKMADDEENKVDGNSRKCSLPVRQEKVRKSSLVTTRTGVRKTSAVCFDDKNTTIETDEPRGMFNADNTETEDTLGDLREAPGDEEEDVPIKFSRKFQDSLKIRRKKSNCEPEKNNV